MLPFADRISVRDHMVAQAAGGQSFFDALKQIGASAIELQVDIDLTTPHLRQANGEPFSIAESGIGRLQQELADAGVRVGALLLGTDFSSEAPEAQVAWTTQAVVAAAALGATSVRIDPLTRNKDLASNVICDNVVAGIGKVLRNTEGLCIDLAIENHGPIGNDPAFLYGVLQLVASPRLGLTLDIGNFYWWGVSLDELYLLLERYAPVARHTHIKNINYPAELAHARRPMGVDYGKHCCSLDEGNIDLSRVVSILTRAGYMRDFCIENESLGKLRLEHRLEALRRDVAALMRARV